MASSEYNLVDVIKSHVKSNNTRLYTQLPAVVTKFYPDKNCIDATLLVSDTMRGSNVMQAGKVINVPVLFPSGGTFQQGFKLVEGDNVLLNFCMRSLDSYHLTDGEEITTMTNRRYHDISDCFAQVGAFPKKNPVVSEAFKGYSYLLDANTSVVFNKGSDGLTISSDKDITVETTGTVNIKGAETVINEGTDYAVQFTALKAVVDSLVAQYNSHVHLETSTTTAAPTIPMSLDMTPAKISSVRLP